MKKKQALNILKKCSDSVFDSIETIIDSQKEVKDNSRILSELSHALECLTHIREDIDCLYGRVEKWDKEGVRVAQLMQSIPLDPIYEEFVFDDDDEED